MLATSSSTTAPRRRCSLREVPALAQLLRTVRLLPRKDRKQWRAHFYDAYCELKATSGRAFVEAWARRNTTWLRHFIMRGRRVPFDCSDRLEV